MKDQALRLALEALESSEAELLKARAKIKQALKQSVVDSDTSQKSVAEIEKTQHMKDEALRLALEAIEEILAAERDTIRTPETVMQAEEKIDRIRKAVKQSENAIVAIKQALEQPEPEPVAWDNCRGETQCRIWCGNSACGSHWNDTSPTKREPEPVECMCGICKLGKRKPLTDEQLKPLIRKAMMYYGHNPDHWTLTSGAGFCILARAIEAAHGIKGEA